MIKTFELLFKLSEETNQKLNILEIQKSTLTNREYKQRKKQILQETKKQTQQINKQYPIKKEIKKLLEEE